VPGRVEMRLLAEWLLEGGEGGAERWKGSNPDDGT